MRKKKNTKIRAAARKKSPRSEIISRLEWIARASCEVNPSGTICAVSLLNIKQWLSSRTPALALSLFLTRSFILIRSIWAVSTLASHIMLVPMYIHFVSSYGCAIVPYIIVTITSVVVTRRYGRYVNTILAWCRYHFCLNYLHAMRCNSDIFHCIHWVSNRKRRRRHRRTHRVWKSKTGERKEKRATQHCQLTSPLIFVFIRNVIMLLPYSGPFCPVCFQFRSFSCFSLFTQNGFAFFSRWNSLAQQIGRQCLQKYI